MNTSKSAIGLQSLCDAIKTMNGRLTHLHLAHNRLAGMPQIIEALAVCIITAAMILSIYYLYSSRIIVQT